MLSRRDLLKTAAAATALSLGPAAAVAPAVLTAPITGGYIRSLQAQAKFQARRYHKGSQFEGDIKGTGKNRVIRLWKLWERVAGIPYVPHFQEIGDCAGQACALALEVQSAVSIAAGGKYEWQGKLSTEALYIASRIEVGQGYYGMFEGSNGAWVVEAAERFGVLPRKDYGKGFDVSEYNPSLADKLSKCRKHRPGEGVPHWLEPEMQKNKLLRAVLIDGGFEQAADFVANGYPIVIASSVGYVTQPDDDGILLRSRFDWDHVTCMWGVDTRSKRKVGCLANSWGTNWVRPGTTYRYGCPPGSFWVDAYNLNKMFAEGDSYALIEYHGPERRDDLEYSFSQST